MKTFTVQTTEGPKEAQQLATFTHYLKGVQFRFVVTLLTTKAPAVTHRGSGLRLADIPSSTIAACRGNMVDAGKLVMINLVTDKGEDKVYAALKKAEGAKA